MSERAGQMSPDEIRAMQERAGADIIGYIASLEDDNAALLDRLAAVERERDLLREAMRQVTYYHHDDYQYCGTCDRALQTFGLLPGTADDSEGAER